MENEESKKVKLPSTHTKILLLACCATCSCDIMERLKFSGVEFGVLFYNPNIDTREEYEKRKNDVFKFSRKLSVPFIEGYYEEDSKRWLKEMEGFEEEPERGKRCEKCFQFRLDKAAELAKSKGINLITSSLGISRWKNLRQVNNCGIKAAKKNYIEYWTYNWRKKGGSNRMHTISKRENFYRQNYCGCKFSKT